MASADKPTPAHTGDAEKAADSGFRPSRPKWLEALRVRVIALPVGRILWKVTVALIGGAVVLLGLILVPLPGPGWAIVFLGLAVWATEFHWAYRLLGFGRKVLLRWTEWARRQSRTTQGAIGLAGLLFLVAVLYLVWRFV